NTLVYVLVILFYLQYNTIHPNGKVNLLKWPVLPLLYMLNNLIGDIRNGAFANINSVYLFYLVADVRSGHTAAVHANDRFFKLIAHALTLWDDLWFKIAFTVPGNVQYQVS